MSQEDINEHLMHMYNSWQYDERDLDFYDFLNMVSKEFNWSREEAYDATDFLFKK